MPETPQSEVGEETGGTPAVEGGATPVVGGSAAGARGLAPRLFRAGTPPGTDPGDSGGHSEAGGDLGAEDAGGESEEPAEQNGAALPGKTRPKQRNSAQDIQRVLRECDGNREFAANVLGISRAQLALRINGHDQLRSLWGQGEVNNANGTPVPREQAINREALVLPDGKATDIELADMVKEGERELHEKGLRELGVGEKVLKRLRGLDKLASNTGQFLALSLEKTHRSYYLQLIELMEVAKDIHDRLMAAPGEPGYITDADERALLNRSYAEMVKEGGRGYELMLTGTQAMVRMMIETAGELPGAGKKKKHGWALAEAKPGAPVAPT